MLAEAMSELGIDEPVHVILVQEREEAIERKFLGSPTIRINGLDVDPSARSATTYGMQCRIYRVGEDIQEWPSKSMVVATFNEVAKDVPS